MIGYGIALLVMLAALGSLALSRGIAGAGKGKKGSGEEMGGQRGSGGKEKGTRGSKKKQRGGRVSALTEAAQPRTIGEANVEPLYGGTAGDLPRGAEARLDPGPSEARADVSLRNPAGGPGGGPAGVGRSGSDAGGTQAR